LFASPIADYLLYSASCILVRDTDMHARPIRHRRGRRSDLMDILRLLAHSEDSAPVPDRALLRRFRRIVADLGDDFYVALIGERLVGFVQISYRRDITRGVRGRVESLIVSRDERPREVATTLASLAEQRARRRSCFELSCAAQQSASDDVSDVLAGSGWTLAGPELRLDLSAEPSKLITSS
jgi:N-acetylglutamate synthase-like GNAT family acetyltransferase